MLCVLCFVPWGKIPPNCVWSRRLRHRPKNLDHTLLWATDGVIRTPIGSVRRILREKREKKEVEVGHQRVTRIVPSHAKADLRLDHPALCSL